MRIYPAITKTTQKKLEHHENDTVEYKQSASVVDADTMVAFANAKGGTILVGVKSIKNPSGDEVGEIIGCDVSDGDRLKIQNIALSCKPSIEVSICIEKSSQNKSIFRVDIPEGPDKPYCTGGGTYKIRIDGLNKSIDPTKMKSMILDAEAERFLERFKLAATELEELMRTSTQFIAAKIDELDQTTYVTALAAREAAQAARIAEQAARDAEKAAVDAGRWAAS